MKVLRLTALILLGCLLVTGCSSGAESGSTPPAVTVTQAAPQTTQAATGTAPAQTAVSTPASASATAVPSIPPLTQPSTSAAPSTPVETLQPTSSQATAAVPETGGQANVPTDSAKKLPDPSGFTWTQIASGVNRPTDIAFIPDNTGRFVVLGQEGTIHIFQNGQILPDPFLDITSRVGSNGNERGLLGIALHPQFMKNGYFYINYTDKDGNTVIARYSVSANNPNQADPNSEKVLLHVDQPFANHNGGSMVFGPDGYLYMGLGDGGSAGDPNGNGQKLTTYLAKILRVDVNKGDPYAIPPENPFVKDGGKPEIWAYGLRNPWRISFDRLSGDLYIADVGQDQWEEIDYQAAGSPGGIDYGWNYREATHPFQGNPPANLKLVDPVFEYSHSEGCSVSGGYVYRGQALPEFRGVYLFADYCSGKIWGLLRGADGTWQGQQLFQDKWNITSFGQDSNGEIYFLDQGSGGVYQLKKK